MTKANYFIHPEHLNTPRLVADATGTTVWKWDQQEPFGNNPADENPSGLGAFDLPLRLPGQYFDKETNLHYNYFRDYDPGIGRYAQSDSIGLLGGLNTYAYVSLDPLTSIDPRGLLGSRGAKPTYCGSGGWKVVVPEGYGGASFSNACKNHDDCYDYCGANKLDCDDRFYRDLVTACGALKGDQLRACRERAMTYYTFVLYYGDGPFRDAQLEACKRCKPLK